MERLAEAERLMNLWSEETVRANRDLEVMDQRFRAFRDATDGKTLISFETERKFEV